MFGSTRRAVAALVIGGLVLATAGGLWIIRPILAPFFIAVAISYLIAPLVHVIAGLGLSRGWAILTVYGVLTGLSVLAVARLIPQVVSQIQWLTEAIPSYSLWAHELVDGLQQRVHDMGAPPELRDVLNRSITGFEQRSLQMLGKVLDISTLQQAAGVLASLLLAPFLSFYILRDIERFKERFVLSLPGRYRQEILALLRGLDRVLAGFVRGQILLALIVGAMAALSLALLGFHYWLLLGIWAGITELIPYVGPLLGAVPAVLVGLSVSPILALETALVFAVIQQLENAVLSPRIMGESVGLHPLAVMSTVLAGGYLFGGWGLILALPVAGLLRVLWHFVVARLTDVPRWQVAAARPEPTRRTNE